MINMQNEIEVGSVTKFFYDSLIKPCNVYTDGLPEDFETPALYFPQPSLLPDKHSNTEYNVNTAIQVKLFGDSDAEAQGMVNSIITRLLNNRNLIPITLIDGSVEKGKFIRITKCDSRPLEDCVMLMSIEWDMKYRYLRDDSAPLINYTETNATLK